MHDLQQENASLRELLDGLGIEAEFVERYLRGRPSSTKEQGTGFRQIRPKIAPLHGQSLLSSSNTESFADSPSSSGSPHLSQSHALAFDDMRPLEADSLSITHGITHTGGSSDPAWLAASTTFCCDSFLVHNTGPLQPVTEETVPCFEAKNWLARYGLTDEQMQMVAIRLSGAFALPAEPGQRCRVSKTVLADVMSDLVTGCVDPGWTNLRTRRAD